MNELRPYLLAWIVLLVLLGITVAGSEYLSGWPSLVVVFGGALCMIGVIVFTFMGLKFLDALMKIYATSGVLWLGFLIVLTMADYITR